MNRFLPLFIFLHIQLLSSLTLQEAALRVGLTSDELQMRKEEIKIKEGEVWQASLLPNPALDLSFENIGNNSKNSYAVNTYEIQTLLELGGKRWERTKLATINKVLAEWDLEESKAVLLASLKKAFFETYLSQEKMQMGKLYVENAKKILDAAQEKMAQGKETKLTFSKAKIAYLQANMEFEKHEREFFLNRQILSSFWNESCPDFETLEFNFHDILPFDDLCTYEMMLTNYPGFIKHQLLIEKAKREIGVQKSNAWPDVLLSLGFEQSNYRGSDGVRLEVNFPLPIFDSNQGKIFSAKHQLVQATLDAKDYYIDLILDFRKVYKNLLNVKDQVKIYRDEIIPVAEEEYLLAAHSFEEGKIGSTEFVQSENVFFENNSAYLEALTSYHKLYADLNQYVRPSYD